VSDGPKEVRITIPWRTLIVASFVVAVAAALIAIGSALLVVFIGIFLALVFEVPVRAFMHWTGRGRGASATIVVLGSALLVTALGLLLLVPLAGNVRDFLKDLPQTVANLRDSGELSWLGDSGAAKNVQEGADSASANVPDAISALVGLALFTILFLALFLLIDMDWLKGAFASIVMPSEEERWLELWERITQTVS